MQTKRNWMKRYVYWDSLKFILIFLVVYAHTISPYKADSPFNMHIYNFIYMFHMPLFIFISGRFSHFYEKKKYIKGIWRLFETFIVFQIVFTIISLVRGEGSLQKYLTTPNWILWYLLSLVFWRLMVYLTPKSWLRHPKTVLIVSLYISLVAGYIPIGYMFAVHRTLSFLPFFVLGYYSSELYFSSYIKRIPLIIAFGTLIAGFVIVSISFNDVFSFVYHCPYKEWDVHVLPITALFPIIRCTFFLFTTILCVMVMRITPDLSILGKWASRTLFIFIYHALVLRLVFSLIGRNIIPQDEILLFIYSTVIIFGLLILSNYRFLNNLLNPISFYYGIFNNRPKS